MTIEELLKLGTKNGLEDNGVKKVVVEYKKPKRTGAERLFFLNRGKITKEFDTTNWPIHRKGIVENLYDKKLCTINFELV